MRNIFIGIVAILMLVGNSLLAQTTVPFFYKSQNASLSWVSPTTNDDGSVLDDLTGFQVLIFNAGADVNTAVPISTTPLGKVNTFAIKTLVTSGVIKNNVVYRVAVVAVDSFGQVSLRSDPIDIKIKVSKPGRPTGLKAD